MMKKSNMLCVEEIKIAKKNIAKQQKYNSKDDNCWIISARVNMHPVISWGTDHEDGNLTSIIPFVSMFKVRIMHK